MLLTPPIRPQNQSSFSPPPPELDAVRRRQVARHLYSLWTRQGSDESGLAEPLLLDGGTRIDVLGRYVTFQEENDDDGDDADHNENLGDNEYQSSLNQQRNLKQEIEKEGIDRVHWKDLSYQEFCDQYMFPNRPVIIQGLAQGWNATTQWTTMTIHTDGYGENDDDTSHVVVVPNLPFLAHIFGSDVVSVQEQAVAGFVTGNVIDRPQPQTMKLEDYAQWWQDYHRHHHHADLTAKTTTIKQQEQTKEKSCNDNQQQEQQRPLLYLKDWKFAANHPTYHAYEWPIYFQDDWLNDFSNDPPQQQPPTNGNNGMHAYQFCYIGPQGSVTVLHADVLHSFSWSSNVCGKKKWYLIPPEYTYLLYDCFGKRLATHLSVHDDDHSHNDKEKGGTVSCGIDTFFPGLRKVRQYAMKIIQTAGETIFVPSKWYHTVENLEATLSINHNWINRANLWYSWEKVRSERIALGKNPPRRNSQPEEQSTPAASDPTVVRDCPCVDDGHQAGGRPRLMEANNDITDCGVDGDLQLLWLIVGKKSNAILNQQQIGGSLQQKDADDLRALKVVLEGMVQLVQEGYVNDFTNDSDQSLNKLLGEVRVAVSLGTQCQEPTTSQPA